MKRLRRNPGYQVQAMALAVLVSCANPAMEAVAQVDGAPSLTLAWNAGGSRSILPT